MPDRTDHSVVTKEGRELLVAEFNPGGRVTVVAESGTPGSRDPAAAWVDAADRSDVRLVTYGRPGYGSTRRPGRTFAHSAGDVAAITDALGIERLGVIGASGGGPPALASAALLPERVKAGAVLASLAPLDAAGLDFFAGMGRMGVVEFDAARRGPHEMERVAGELAAEFEGRPSSLTAEFADSFGGVERESLTRLLAGGALAGMKAAPGVDGWVDDDLAAVAPWGFDPATITSPLLVIHGGRDRLVPIDHGRWIAERVGGAEMRLLVDEGHISATFDHFGEALEWVAARVE